MRRRLRNWLMGLLTDAVSREVVAISRERMRQIVRAEIRDSQPTGWKATEQDPWWQEQRARREAERGAMLTTPKDVCLQRLRALACEGATEQSHAGADQTLLLYIADDEIRTAYEAVPR